LTSLEKPRRQRTHTYNRSWKPIVTEAISKINDYNSRGIRPTLRTIFYYLYSKKLIDNSQGDYTQLSNRLVKARKNGDLPWGSLADNTRKTIFIPPAYCEPVDYLNSCLELVEKAPGNYRVPRWHNQPYYIEFWIEKDAMVPMVASILRSREVAIAINRGNDGWEHFDESIKRIEEQLDKGKKVRIFYLGDYDPSGRNMPHELGRRIQARGHILHNTRPLNMEIVAITKEQIKNLPRNKDPKTLEKLENDPNSEKFRAENNEELFAIELDAFAAYQGHEFEQLLLDTADEFFIEDVFQKVKTEEFEGRKRISRLVNKMNLCYTDPPIADFWRLSEIMTSQ
jgi:hypothetical protein